MVALVAWLFPVAVGVAVVIAGWHRPSDSIAAFCVVLGRDRCCARVRGRRLRFRSHGERPLGVVPAFGPDRSSALSIAVLVALSLAGLWLVRDQLRGGDLSARWDSVAFASAAAAIIAGAGLMLLFLVATSVRGMAIGHGGWHRDAIAEAEAPATVDSP